VIGNVSGLRLLQLSIALSALLVACGDGGDKSSPTPSGSQAQATASAVEGELRGLGSESLPVDRTIPSRFTCDGEEVSPALSWGAPPPGTESLMLIMDDPDAPGGRFTHWLIYNLDTGARGLPEGVEKIERPANGAGGIQGKNDFGDSGYGSPCPPAGNAHHYDFALIYLDALIELESGASKDEMVNAVKGHELGRSSFTATYQR